MPFSYSTYFFNRFDKGKMKRKHNAFDKRYEIINISQVHLNIIKLTFPFYKAKAQQEHFKAQKGTDKPLKHSLNTSNWNVECWCGEKHTQTDRTALSVSTLEPNRGWALMLVFRGPEALWTFMSGWTQALGSPWWAANPPYFPSHCSCESDPENWGPKGFGEGSKWCGGQAKAPRPPQGHVKALCSDGCQTFDFSENK